MKFLISSSNPEYSDKIWNLVFYDDETNEIIRETIDEGV